MKKDKSIPVILGVTFYLVCYVLLLSSDATMSIAVFMFSLSPVVIVWMVVTVLKQEIKNNKTFDEYFYDDAEEKRSPSS